MNLSTDARRRARLLVNSWPSIGGAPGIDDGGEIVGADVALDELARRAAHADGTPGIGLQIVEHEHEDAAVELLAVAAARRDRSAVPEERRILPFDRQVDAREHFNRLRGSVLEDLEVIFRQIIDELSLRIRGARIDLDVVDLDSERGRRLSRCLRGLPHERRGGDSREEARP